MPDRPETHTEEAAPERPLDFVRAIVADDLKNGVHQRIATRFPPEPNGFLHIGHAKSICLNFGIARDFADLAQHGTRCHLRFDDTNPIKEEQVYIDAIRKDVRWLGFDWGEHEYYASDYFDQLYEWAILLIKAGKAYVCDLDGERIRQTRGTLTEPGTPSPYRDRSAAESLDLFSRMKAGEFPDGSRVLRAKIDMASPNLNMRDPVMYRILHTPHPRTGDQWCIYPMYDWAHGQSDWIEGITHSICTLEFEAHRPLYDWFIQEIQAAGGKPAKVTHRPRQYEFARLNLTHTMMSKRRLLALVQENIVAGWDDPRMPTISGMRRRGYTPVAVRNFCERIGVAKRENTIEVGLLEHFVRDDLNKTAPRRMAVLNPLKVVIESYPEGQAEEMDAVNNPEDEAAGTRKVPFSCEIYIERDDFMEDPPKKFFRLAPGKEVRLRYAYWVTCTDVIKDDQGHVVELRCTHDPATRGGNNPPDGRKVKGTIHWVSAAHAVPAQVRLYEHLFMTQNPGEVPDGGDGGDWRDQINPDSLRIQQAVVEPALTHAAAEQTFQFERLGYFCVDQDSTADSLVFNRTVTLKDSWGKMAGKKK